MNRKGTEIKPGQVWKAKVAGAETVVMVVRRADGAGAGWVCDCLESGGQTNVPESDFVRLFPSRIQPQVIATLVCEEGGAQALSMASSTV